MCGPQVRFCERFPPANGGRLLDLCAPDVPWVEDAVRYRPEGGKAFWERCRRRLEKEERKVVQLSGSWEQRWKQAIIAVDSIRV